MQRASWVQLALLLVGLVLFVGGLSISGEGLSEVDELSALALGLAVVLTAAKIGGELAGRLGQPSVLGEILAGVILGNLPGLEPVRGFGSVPHLDVLARLGMLLLLFETGLELSVVELFAVGGSALLVAVIGTVASFGLGVGAAILLLPGASTAVHLFLGASITATSVGITARVLKDIGASRGKEAKIILGAAVVDDVLALVVLALVTAWLTSLQSGAILPWTGLAALCMKTVGFLVLAIVIGAKVTPLWFRQAARMRTTGTLLAIGLCFCFLLSWAASAIGLAALVGAFAAGLVLEEAHYASFVERGERSLGELIAPITSFLVPVFFVLVGMNTNLRSLTDPASLAFPLVLTVAAVGGKLACSLGVLAPGTKRLTIGIAMIPRGEVTLVFAAMGTSLKIGDAPFLDPASYSALVAMVILTTLVAPGLLKWSVRAGARPAALSERET